MGTITDLLQGMARALIPDPWATIRRIPLHDFRRAKRNADPYTVWLIGQYADEKPTDPLDTDS